MKYHIYISLLLLSLPLSFIGQWSYQHSCDIQSLTLINDTLIFSDSNQESYTFDFEHRPVTTNKAARLEHSLYGIDNGRLVENIGDNFSYLEFPYAVSAVIQTTNNNWVVSSPDHGLFHFKDNNYKKYYVPGIQFPKSISDITFHQKKLWFLTTEGSLYQYDTERQLLHYIDTSINAYALDSWNTLYFSKGKNVHKNTDYINKKSPIVKLTSVSIDENNQLVIELLQVSEKSNVTLGYHITYPPLPTDLLYEYRWDESEWTSTESNYVTLNNLKSGNHKFQFRARDSEIIGYSDIVPIKVNGNVQDKLAIALFLGILALLSLAFYMLKKKKREHDALAVEKEKLILDLDLLRSQQKLGQLQMNPHFIFNTINSINGLIAQKESTLARRYLNKFASMMRSLLEQSKGDFITLGNELKFLEQYLALELMMRNNKFEYQIENSAYPNLRIPPMLIQPLLENAIIHGLEKKEGVGQLQLTITASTIGIDVIIKDNGVGRNATKADKKNRHNSSAIAIIKNRLAVNNKWNKDDNLIYTDLIAGNQSQGTQVLLKITTY